MIYYELLRMDKLKEKVYDGKGLSWYKPNVGWLFFDPFNVNKKETKRTGRGQFLETLSVPKTLFNKSTIQKPLSRTIVISRPREICELLTSKKGLPNTVIANNQIRYLISLRFLGIECPRKRKR